MDQERDKIEKVTGSAPVECPWFSLARPEVQEIAHLHRTRENGMLEVAFGGVGNMPSRLASGLREFDRGVQSALEHFDRLKEMKKREPGGAFASVRRLGLKSPRLPPNVQRGRR